MVLSLVNSSGTIPTKTFWFASISPHASLSFAFDVLT